MTTSSEWVIAVSSRVLGRHDFRMIYAEANVVCVAYEDDCNMHGWFPCNSLMIAMLYLEFSVNEMLGPLRAEMIVNFVQSTTYRTCQFLVATRRFLLESWVKDYRSSFDTLLTRSRHTHILLAASARRHTPGRPSNMESGLMISLSRDTSSVPIAVSSWFQVSAKSIVWW